MAKVKRVSVRQCQRYCGFCCCCCCCRCTKKIDRLLERIICLKSHLSSSIFRPFGLQGRALFPLLLHSSPFSSFYLSFSSFSDVLFLIRSSSASFARQQLSNEHTRAIKTIEIDDLTGQLIELIPSEGRQASRQSHCLRLLTTCPILSVIDDLSNSSSDDVAPVSADDDDGDHYDDATAPLPAIARTHTLPLIVCSSA